MANPRQRRKARSSTHKPVKQSRRANKNLKKHKPIKGSKVLQEAWDGKITVRQNYAALGLAHRLDPDPIDSGRRHSTRPTGAGSESLSHQSTDAIPHRETDTGGPDACSNHVRLGESSTNHREGSMSASLRQGFGRLIRDESGAIVDVILAEEAREHGGEGAESEAMLQNFNGFEIGNAGSRDSEFEHGQQEAWLLRSSGEVAKARSVVQALEVEASSKASKTPRSTSSAELKYLQALQEAYGNDFEAMSRDRKRNVQQYTAGQLRRSFAKAGLQGERYDDDVMVW